MSIINFNFMLILFAFAVGHSFYSTLALLDIHSDILNYLYSGPMTSKHVKQRVL